MATYPDRHTLTVTQLNRTANQLLGDHFFSVWVEGEVSNLSIPSSGHWYFTLKDANAQIRCAMFRNQQRRLTAKPENGKHVVVHGQLGLYEPRGDYQLIVDSIEEAGDGALRWAFEALKLQLADAGLFDSRLKKPLPPLPTCIGVVTSPTGAAIRDILTVLRRRFPAIPVIVYPVAVQGNEAQHQIAHAITLANAEPRCDVLIVGRGGGSLEDLWAFNEEKVARAIFASEIPIIAAVGHETDVTIADFAADIRAATPSAAAELAVPSQAAWIANLEEIRSRIGQLQRQQIKHHQQKLAWLSGRLQQQHPGQKLMRNSQRLDELDTRLQQAIHRAFQQRHQQLQTKTAQLGLFNPKQKMAYLKHRQIYLSQRLYSALKLRLEKSRQQLSQTSQTLNTVSPLATLNRGYALVTLVSTGELLRSATQAKENDFLEIDLAEGKLSSQVIHRTVK